MHKHVPAELSQLAFDFIIAKAEEQPKLKEELLKRTREINNTCIHKWLEPCETLSPFERLVLTALFCNNSLTHEQEDSRVRKYIKSTKLLYCKFYKGVYLDQQRYRARLSNEEKASAVGSVKWTINAFLVHVKNVHALRSGKQLTKCSVPQPWLHLHEVKQQQGLRTRITYRHIRPAA